MADRSLHEIVLGRLEGTTQPEDEWSAPVLAALDGSEALETLLDPSASAATPAAAHKGKAPSAPESKAAPAAPPRVAFLRSITIEGFRGIGPQATLDRTPAPGLTLVVGRNGSGKSSFAEGLELLLTGDTHRWSQRTEVWRDGWKNLHHPKAALAAEFAFERRQLAEQGPCPGPGVTACSLRFARTRGRAGVSGVWRPGAVEVADAADPSDVTRNVTCDRECRRLRLPPPTVGCRIVIPKEECSDNADPCRPPAAFERVAARR